MTAVARPRALPAAALIALVIAAIASPAAHAAWTWPLSESAKARHSGKTVNTAAQHPVRPLGNHLRAVKPLGGTRPPAKTILAKRPP